MIHTVPPNGALIEVAGEGIYLARGTAVPTDGTPGYAPGCDFIHTTGVAGSRRFSNDGTVESCDFDAITVA